MTRRLCLGRWLLCILTAGRQSARCVITGMSKIAGDSPGLARAFQQRQRCLLCRLPSVAIELSDRRPAPTKATPPILVSTVFGHCETPLLKINRDHTVTFGNTSDTGCWLKRRPGCWFQSFSEKKVVKQSSVQVQPERGPDVFRGCSIDVLSCELAVVTEPLSGPPD